MGGFKPLLDVGGKPALLRLLDTISSVAAIGTIAVVTGHKHELLEEAIRLYTETTDEHRLHTIYNADHESGMFSSIQTGIRCLTQDGGSSTAQGGGSSATQGDGSSSAQGGGSSSAQGGGSSTAQGNPISAALLFPADVPLVAEGTIAGLIDAWELRLAAEAFAVPVFEGRNGHPLLIPHGRFEEILCFSGKGGLKAVRSRYDAEMVRYVTGDEGCVLDMDTLEDHQALLKYYEEQKQK